MTEPGHWSPDSAVTPDLELLATLAAAATGAGAGESEGADEIDPEAVIDPAERLRFAPLMRQVGEVWPPLVAQLSDDQLLALVRFFTVAEMRLSGWRGDGKSPVIPMSRELKKRGSWSIELTRWVKSRTDNRFLPYGSLGDRLG